MHASPRLCRRGKPRRRPLIVLSLLGLVLVAGGPETRPTELPKPPVKDFTGKPAYEVLSVPAGNMLIVRLKNEKTTGGVRDGEADARPPEEEATVRLIGTYVPQSGGDSDEARAYTQRLLEGESVYIEYEPDWPQRDREERIWAYVYRVPDGLFVNLELIRGGYARISAAEPFEHLELLRTYEGLARRNHKGVWSPRPAGGTVDPATSRPGERAGADPAPRKPTAADEALVYVTPSGKKYHRKDCQHVRNGASAVTLQAAKSRGLTPCSRCKPPE